jgi:hypothetical protein
MKTSSLSTKDSMMFSLLANDETSLKQFLQSQLVKEMKENKSSSFSDEQQRLTAVKAGEEGLFKLKPRKEWDLVDHHITETIENKVSHDMMEYCSQISDAIFLRCLVESVYAVQEVAGAEEQQQPRKDE